MKGYKIAVGIDKEKGPFPVVIELEILDNAIVVTPFDKLRFHNPSDMSYIFETRTYVPPSFMASGLIQKYRTDKVKVNAMCPLADFMTAWNHKAYSFYELSCLRDYFEPELPKVIYTVGKEIYEDVLQNQTVPCGSGINYFASIEDVKNYYYNDASLWAFNLMHGFSQLWCSENIINFEDNKLKKLLKELSI